MTEKDLELQIKRLREDFERQIERLREDFARQEKTSFPFPINPNPIPLPSSPFPFYPNQEQPTWVYDPSKDTFITWTVKTTTSTTDRTLSKPDKSFGKYLNELKWGL